jgi:transcription-repair coupling factor (superfamily II helicase)
LYQLRGRVGRGGEQAYAYLLIPDEGTLTGDAQKRLIAIQQFTELGSGFRIAAADLEIRGAGNLLGKQQSGHIAAIGLDLYMQMVEQAVQRLKGHIIEDEPDPTLQFPISAFIPEQYVADPHHRLSFYKRLTACRQVGELALLHGEIQDRYGPTPEPVERLLEVMQLRTHAIRLRLTSIEVHGQTAKIVFHQKAVIPETSVHRLMDRLKKRLRFLSPIAFEIQMRQDDWPSVFSELNTILQSLDLCDTKTIQKDTTAP